MKLFGGTVINTGFMFSASIVRSLSAFVLIMYAARVLGVTGFGEFSFVLSFFAIFLAFSRLGLQSLVTREVAKDRSKAGKYLINASFLGFLASLVMIAAMSLIITAAKYSVEIRMAVYILSVSLIATTTNYVFESIFIAFKRVRYIFYSTIILNLFKLSLCMILLFKGYGIVSLAAVISAAPFVNLVFNLWLFQRYIEKLKFQIDTALFKWIARLAPTFSGIAIFHSLDSNAIVILLSKLKGTEEIAYYTVAFKIVLIVNLALQSYRSGIQPVMAKLFETSQKKFRDFSVKALRYVYILTIPLALGTTILADKIVILLFTDDFLVSANVLRILVWTLIPYGTTVVLSCSIIASNNQRIDLRAIMVSMITNILLSLLLIQRFSYLGAASAFLISRCIAAGFRYFFISRELYAIGIIKDLGKIILSALLMGFFVLVFDQINVFVLTVLAILIYACSLLLVNLRTVFGYLKQNKTFFKLLTESHLGK